MHFPSPLSSGKPELSGCRAPDSIDIRVGRQYLGCAPKIYRIVATYVALTVGAEVTKVKQRRSKRTAGKVAKVAAKRGTAGKTAGPDATRKSARPAKAVAKRGARAKAGARSSSTRTVASKGTRRGARTERVPVRGVKIRALDPREKCGQGTSVLQLYRVDETLDGALSTHLVFFDRHGWYCEHGRNCRVVDDVRKHGKHNGRDPRGRMRA